MQYNVKFQGEIRYLLTWDYEADDVYYDDILDMMDKTDKPEDWYIHPEVSNADKDTIEMLFKKQFVQALHRLQGQISSYMLQLEDLQFDTLNTSNSTQHVHFILKLADQKPFTEDTFVYENQLLEVIKQLESNLNNISMELDEFESDELFDCDDFDVYRTLLADSYLKSKYVDYNVEK